VLVVGAGYYLLVGFQRTAVKFWYAMAFMVLTAVNAATAGLLVGLLTPNLDMAFPLLCLVCTVLLSFCGFMGEEAEGRGGGLVLV
jgi:ABC-type multidrug transport system permease subunit